MATTRVARVSEGIKVELASLIGTEASDPRLEGVIISAIELSGDLRLAKVRVRLLQGGDDLKIRERALKGLASASGFLRHQVSDRLKLRHPPELRFVYDEGQDARMRVEEILHEINTEKK
jgi:ribosome-binding factor A